MEVWERVFVDSEVMANDFHGNFACTECHGGQNVEDKYAAHDGMIVDPSVDAVESCGMCHGEIAEAQETSLHNSMRGYDTALYERSIPDNHPAIEEGQSYHCDSCHTTCGQCHISQPDFVGGGLINGHAFQRTPSMSRNCTACHGSRVKNEYTGAHEELSADVHLRMGRMVCTACHTGDEMHGVDYTEETVMHRYDGPQGPSCESCHGDMVGAGNAYHEAHGAELLSCQTCHSVSYMNCYDCHLERTEDTDLPYFRLEHENLGFYIGQNTLQSEERPYQYVPVRHVPTFPDLFELYGEDLLSNFDSRPTWTYATPHNIQRNTPQTESCASCHGNDQYFLTADKIRPEDLLANESVVVPSGPPLMPDMADADGEAGS